MALSIAETRAGLCEILESLPSGWHVFGAPDQITPPCWVVGVPTIEYDQSFGRGVDSAEVMVWAVVPVTSWPAAIELLTGAAESDVDSLKYALDNDRRLAGVTGVPRVQSSHLFRAEPVQYPGPGGPLPAYEFTVKVIG